MPTSSPLNSGVSGVFLVAWILISCFSGFVLSAVVTLDSMKIYRTHEWLKSKPTVYFHCEGENNKTVLPDVKEVNVSYTFNGEESWQPLTEFTSKKCKRCGFYEKNEIISDDVFYEWEFCPSDFSDSNGKYKLSKEKEFDATFLCKHCESLSADSNIAPGSHKRHNAMHLALVIMICVLATTVLVLGIVAAFRYWQKKKRAQDQARFLKLFEDGDDIEDELGLGTVI